MKCLVCLEGVKLEHDHLRLRQAPLTEMYVVYSLRLNLDALMFLDFWHVAN